MAADLPRCQRSHWHVCPQCRGAGEFTFNNSNPYGYGPDPQQDQHRTCVDCRGMGGYRFTRTDCLETLGYYRRGVLRSPAAFSRAYAAQRARCVRLVVLP